MTNTLFLGNGFSRCIKNQKSWTELLKRSAKDDRTKEYKKDHLYTFAYEESLLGNTRNCTSNTVRCENPIHKCDNSPSQICEMNLKERLKRELSIEDDPIADVEFTKNFLAFLKENEIENIITTNYDTLIEKVLEQCGYKYSKEESDTSENIYSIRRCLVFQKNDHRIQLWKIHGDVNKVESIMLGYDHYCGSISKLNAYIKGTYKHTTRDGNNVKIRPIYEKCMDCEFDHLSWAELFFETDIYFIGFGLDYSEMDIWWILNRRARLKRFHDCRRNIKNRLVFYTTEEEGRKEELLEAFDVSYDKLNFDFSTKETNPEYLYLVFDKMKQRRETTIFN